MIRDKATENNNRSLSRSNDIEEHKSNEGSKTPNVGGNNLSPERQNEESNKYIINKSSYQGTNTDSEE